MGIIRTTRVLAALVALAAPIAGASAQWDVDPIKPRQKDAPAKKPAKPDSEAERLRREAEKVFERTDSSGRPTGAGAVNEQSWVVAVVLLGDAQQTEAAEIMLREIRTRGMLPEAYAQKRAKGTLIAVGAFKGPTDPAAQAELQRVQTIEIDGQRPYVTAWLAPPMLEGLAGSRPEYALTNAREVYGDRAVYTLQVGVYGRMDLDRPSEGDLAEARKKAEEAAVRLRQEGDEAFYHHGPRYSTVTVGVFDLKDFDPQVPSYKSSRLRDVQARYPNNLYNGAAIKEKMKGGVERLQPSNLVAIPQK